MSNQGVLASIQETWDGILGCVEPKPGSQAISGPIIQGLYAVHVGLLAGTLMKAADARAGGFGGVSYGLAVSVIITTWVYSYIIAGEASSGVAKFVISLFSGLLFGLLIMIGIAHPWSSFGFQSPGNPKPFYIATLIYAFGASIVLFRLQRTVSPPNESKVGLYREHHTIFFENSWRMFQIMLSLAVAVIVGVIFPVGVFVAQRQEIVIGPIAWYLVGILTSFLPLVGQFLYEIAFLEQVFSE